MDGWDIKILFDGQCPLCRREMAWLRKRDKLGRVAFEDIAAPEFDAAKFGRTQAQVMDRIHAQLPDGSIVEGVEVFRRAYKAIGLGWLVAWTRWPVLKPIADWAYRVFARNRMRLTFRKQECTSERCSVSH
ncbi:MAG: DUF393 domain-containing protein [Tepidisphaeraceae bacterium]